MALIATLTQPVVISAPSDSFSAIIPNRFPTPPRSFGFLGTVDFDMQLDGISSPYLLTGVIYPETKYLEPTIGQIWPR